MIPTTQSMLAAGAEQKPGVCQVGKIGHSPRGHNRPLCRKWMRRIMDFPTRAKTGGMGVVTTPTRDNQ